MAFRLDHLQLCEQMILDAAAEQEEKLAKERENMKHVARHNERLANKNAMLATKNAMLLAQNARFALRTREKRLNRQKCMRSHEKIVEKRVINGVRQSGISLLRMSEASHEVTIKTLAKELAESKASAEQIKLEHVAKLAVSEANVGKLCKALSETSAKLEESQGWVRHYKTFAEAVEETATKNSKAVEELNDNFTRENRRLEKCLSDRKGELLQAKGQTKELETANAKLEAELANAKIANAELAKSKIAFKRDVSKLRGEVNAFTNRTLESVAALEAQAGVASELRAANERLGIDYREACAQAQTLYGLLERSERGLKAIHARERHFEDSCSAEIVAVQQQVHPPPPFLRPLIAPDAPAQIERLVASVEALGNAIGLKHVLDWEGRFKRLEAAQAPLDAAYKKDLREWEERCAELVAELEGLKKARPPAGRSTSPKSDTKKLEQEVAALTTRLAEKEVDARRFDDAIHTAKNCLTAQREKARSLQAERDTLEEQNDWLKKQGGILLKSNEVFVSHFLYSAAQALPEFKGVISRIANDKTAKETIYLYMKSVTTRGITSLLDRVVEMVSFIQEHRADLLLPNEEYVKTYFVEDADGW